MNFKNPETDSGNYINGVYTTKNGYNLLGLNCPKGTRLFDTNLKPAVYFVPDDIQTGEDFKIIDDNAAKDILPNYYAISNYGRIMNIRSNKLMKPNYRPNGYEYYCLAASNCKYGQKKYNTHRLVMKTFEPTKDMDILQVNHINANKKDNYINKIMSDGSIKSNLEWVTPKENIEHIQSFIDKDTTSGKINYSIANQIRHMHDQGYSYEQIINNGFDYLTYNTIQNICQNKIYKKSGYVPKIYNDSYKSNPANVHKLTDSEVSHIRELKDNGYKYEDIKNKFYPEFSIATISDICRQKTHNR